MIKKIIYVLTVIIAISIANLSYQSTNNNDYYRIQAIQDYVAVKESKDRIAITLSFDKDTLNQNMEKISQYCLDNQITITMCVGNNDSKGVAITHFYVLTNNDSLFDDLKIEDRRDIDFSKKDLNQYYTTVSTDAQSQGILRTVQDGFYDTETTQVILHNMASVESAIINNGFQINAYLNLPDKENDYDKLMDMFKAEHVFVEDITAGYSPAQLEILSQQSVDQLRNILLLSIVMVGLLLCVYFLKAKRKMMIKRLNGVSIINILFKEAALFFLMNIMLFAITLLITTLLLCGMIQFSNKDLYMLNMKMIIGYIVLHIILCIGLYIFIHLTSHIKYLKKNFTIHHFMEITVLLKVVIIGFILPQLIVMGSDMISSINEYIAIRDNEELVNNSAFFDGELGLSEPDLVFNYYMEHEGLYADFDSYYFAQRDYLKEWTPEEYWYQIDEMAIDYPMIYANANYLKGHDIKDIHGKLIDLKQYKEDVLLVPQRYANEELDKAMYSKKREIIYIKDTDTYFNMRFTEPLTLSNPVIHLVTQKSTEVKFQDYLFVPTKDKSILEYQKEIETMGYGKASLRKNNFIVSNELKTAEDQIKGTVFIVSIYLVFMMTLIYQSVYLYIHENQLRISLGYMNGYSRWDRYQELFIYIPLTYIFIFLTGFFILQLNVSALIAFCLISMGVEVLTHFMMIRRFESRNISAILKGESEL